jgi:hypothetical protein
VLVESVLANAFEDIYNQMDAAAGSAPKTNKWFAEQLAKAITDQIKTAEVESGISVQGGTQSGGSLVSATTSAKGKIS